jgi:ADP-heptose:LPS heptosyltransferase
MDRDLDQSRRIPERALRVLRRIARAIRYHLKRLTGRRVLIHVENRWRIGDEILAIPFYELLHRQFPTARISVSVNYPEFLAGQSDCVVDTGRTEFDCDRYIFLSEDMPGTTRLESLCRRHGVSFSPLEPQVRVPVPDTPVSVVQPCIAYSVGAGWVCRQWPPEHMRRLLTHLQAAHPKATFVELGKDCPGVGTGEDMRDKLDLSESARILKACCVFIGPDSGLIHLALAVGTPVVGLYGPVKPAEAFGPRERLAAVVSPEPCHGCWTDRRMSESGVCALGIDGHSAADYPCMQMLTPDAVFRQIEAAGVLKDATA